jgi:lactose/L-arabinose transport system permease protein
MRKLKGFSSYFVLTIVSIFSVFPLFWMVVSATNKSVDVIAGKLLPGTYLFENLKSLLNAQNVGGAMLNSLRNSIVLTFVALLICSIAGYGFEIYNDKAKDTVMSILLLAMMVPFAATLIPLFQMFSKMGFLDSTIGFILP